jgi:hypothetical protein
MWTSFILGVCGSGVFFIKKWVLGQSKITKRKEKT